MMANDHFGKQLRAIRSAQNLSQGEVAERAGLSIDAISNLERGVNHPSYGTLLKLSEVLATPVRDFFEVDEGSIVRSEAIVSLIATARLLDDNSLQGLVEIAQVLKKLDQ